MASDFHTHHKPAGYRALVSSSTPIAGYLTSFEFHPWNLPQEFIPELLPEKELLSKFAAIGEIGLDKLHLPDIKIQQQYLEKLFELSVELHKPVIIHCVRAFDEFFALLKRFPIKAMVHGFRSSPEMLDELWKKKVTVSFHPQMVHNPALMQKLSAAKGCFGFESDDKKNINIEILINIAKNNTQIADLEKITDQNFSDFLEI
ncbi:MAG: TatD family hydrolase [Lentisphaeria bacterium]|nr:TatD family hydrolase [Lentisphaeria bacterium]